MELTGFVHGSARAGTSEAWDNINPATGRPIASCRAFSAADVDAAVASAQQGFDGRASPRGAYQWSFADGMTLVYDHPRVGELSLSYLDAGKVTLPMAAVVDWPDLAERGEWGGNAAWDLASTAPLKLNLVEVGVLPGFDEHGKLRLTRITPPIDEAARALGVKALPYVPHLGDFLNAVKPTVDGGGRLVLVSTADKARPLSPFKRLFRAAWAGTGDYAAVFLPWSARPGRDERW